MKPILVYITTPDEKDAEMIGAALIKKKLASCVNIISNIHCQFMWKGKFQHDKEAVMMVKTFDTKYKALEKAVKKIHCYENPCIVAIPITKGSREYLTWSRRMIK